MRWVLLSAFLLLLGCSAPPVEVTQLWEREALDVWPGTIKSDTIDNLVAVLSDATVEPRDQNMLSAGNTVSFPAGTLTYGPVTAGAVDSTHVWVSYKHGDTAILYDLRGRRRLFTVVGKDIDATVKGWDGCISGVQVADLKGDGGKEALVRVMSCWDRSPRAVVELNWDDGSQIARFDCGPGPEKTVLCDINADGRDEILLGTWAPLNHNTANGLSDTFTYAIALDCNLVPNWIARLGRYSSTVHVAVMNRGNGASPVLLACEVGNSAGGRHCDSIWLLDPLKGRRLRGTTSGSFNTGFTVLEDARRGTLAATAGSDNMIRLYDSQLRLIGCRHVPGVGAGAELSAGHFTGSRSQEIAVNAGASAVLIFDSRLRKIAEIPARGPESLRPVRHGSHDRLLMRTSMDSTSTWRLYEMQIVPFFSRGIALWLALPAFALLLLLLAASIVHGRYRQTRDVRAVVRGLTGQAGIVEFNRQGVMRHANPKAKELLGAGATLPGPLAQAVKSTLADAPESQSKELPVVLDSGKTVLARAAHVRSGVLLTLEDVSTVEYLKRVSTWVPVAQKLAHDIKNPLTAISLALQRVGKAAGPDSQRYVDSMKDDIDRLKKMADGFMRLTKLEPPRLVPADINDIVRQCAGKFEGVKPAGIEFRYDLAEGLPPVALDRDQMAVACSNIIENAVSAIAGSGAVAIRTSYNVEEKKVVVSIQDTGKGIPERYLAKVFEPYFTLKPGGTGLGMALTKRIIEDHKGTIAIESTEGKGTTVTITLPTT